MNNDPRKSRASHAQESASDSVSEQTLVEFFSAARTGNRKKIEALLYSGVSPNVVEPSTGFTLLHYISSRGITAGLNTLLRRCEFDHLLRDHLGRLPSELAATVAEDSRLAGRLRTLEIEQADRQGVTLTYRPRPPISER